MPYARNLVLDFQPGTKWAYSAVTGPDILARIVEITAGLSFDCYLKERIFEPVDMRDAGFNLDARQRARVVPRYARKNEAWHREPGDAELANKLLPRSAGPNPIASYYSGSFGLFCTARDSLLFETMLLNEGTIHGKRVLRPESVALMRSNLVGDLYDALGSRKSGQIGDQHCVEAPRESALLEPQNAWTVANRKPRSRSAVCSMSLHQQVVDFPTERLSLHLQLFAEVVDSRYSLAAQHFDN